MLYSLMQTINDVITGIIFYGIRLYMQEISHNSSKAQCVAVVLLSTRTVSGYKSVQEMVIPDSDVPWGNKFSFLHIPIPKFTDLKSLNPTEFVLRAHNMIKKKKNSSAIYFTAGSLLMILDKLRGPEVHTI